MSRSHGLICGLHCGKPVERLVLTPASIAPQLPHNPHPLSSVPLIQATPEHAARDPALFCGALILFFPGRGAPWNRSCAVK